MALVIFIALLMLEAAARAVGQQGFLSIDCGLEESNSNYTDFAAKINYVLDGPYVDAGENNKVAADYQDLWGRNYRSLNTLRSFPSGEQNCYALPTSVHAKYLVRLEFLYGNYDDKNSSFLEFNLTLGVNHWDTVSLNTTDGRDGYTASEAVFVAWASWAPVCLVNTGGGTPFVSTLELRPLGYLPYPAEMGYQSLFLYERRNMGPTADDTLRYPDDVYDRFWYPWRPRDDPTYSKISTTSSIEQSALFAVPSTILQTAVVPVGNSTVLTITTRQDKTLEDVMVFLHLADFQNGKFRQFTAYIDDELFGTYNPQYNIGDSNFSNFWYYSNEDRKYNLTLAATAASKLPPMLNAFEVYGCIAHDNPTTFSQDFNAIMSIKLEYSIKKNWMGDPCFPAKYAWDGVKCSNSSDNNTRIISLDISNSNLHGLISYNFTLLTALKSLNLSGNQLTGEIPDSFCKTNGRSFDFSHNSDGLVCSPPSKHKTSMLVVSIMVPVLVVAILALAYFIWRPKRKPNNDPQRVPELTNAQVSTENHWHHLQKNENRQFTYEELEKFTGNFKRLIGHGGFGHVYYGCLENSTEVAIKIRSESSSHGLHQFLAEVQSLTKVHHRNLVYLVGYCWEKDHLALVYEYMSRGNLCDHIRGKIGMGEKLNWATRVRVVLDAAQGLDYLHKGCNLPIIHGDVKTNNILLGHKLNAKIADFGLSKTYHSDTQSHISATAAGSMGYIDPEYYTTGRLTESSDVYSFGIVLLEVVTGEPPIIPGHGHIVQHVKQKIVTGNILSIADSCLQGACNVSSMWKIVDTALKCVADVAAQRPTMATVVVQLKESLALEEAHGDKVDIENLASDTTSFMSTIGPTTR